MDPVGLVVIAVGVGIAALGWWLYRRKVTVSDHAARTWKRVVGTLHEASVRDEVTWDSQNDKITEYQPVVRYSFRADGRDHEGMRAFLTRTKFDSEQAGQAWLAQRAPGSPVTIWHDPADPSKSALELDRPDKVGLVVAGVFAVIAIGVGASLL